MVASANAHCQHRCLYHPSSFKNGRRECQFVIHYREPGRNFSLPSGCFYLGSLDQNTWGTVRDLTLAQRLRTPGRLCKPHTPNSSQTYKRDIKAPFIPEPTLQETVFEESFLNFLKISNTEIQIDMGRELSWLSGKWRKIREYICLSMPTFHIS